MILALLVAWGKRFNMRMPLLWCVVAGVLLSQSAAANPPRQIPLPAFSDWETESADFKGVEGGAELLVPINYPVGRAVSPGMPVEAGELVTLAANVTSRYDGSQQSFYRCWLEVEFLDGKRVLQTASTPEIVGTQEAPDLLAVTAAAPPGTTSMRAAICAQNKFWSIVDNRVAVSDVRLLRLDGAPGKNAALAVSAALPRRQEQRSAKLTLKADWPDGTAFAITTSRGETPRTVLLNAGRAEVAVQYGAEDVGAARVTAKAFEREAAASLSDPVAGTLEIGSILADGRETPALVQLTRDGEMLPGRYQISMPGICMQAPWTIDLAPGEWQLRICRGPEFQAFEQTLSVASSGKITLDEVELQRNVDLQARGWYGGDADGDVYHGERIYTDVSAETAAEIALAMGMDWIGCGNWDDPNPKTWGEARAALQELSRPHLLFLWTDEKPKSREGHVCLVGIERPDDEPFGWGWVGARRPLRNFEQLQVIRASGAATFVNHPLRWWTSGDKFRTNMYAGLPFDLCAARLLDGYNINEKPDDLKVWSMLLEHGYPVAATAGTDFCLDRPSGPPPGKIRMYCYCPDGLSGRALADAVRNSHTIVSAGPVLVADLEGQPPGTRVESGDAYTIRAEAWAKGSEPDALQRIELWSHGRAIATETIEGNAQHATAKFQWSPTGEWDWAVVRVVSRRGWAMTSAFYAASPDWRPPEPVQCEAALHVSGLNPKDRAASTVEVWNTVPALATARKLSSQPLEENMTLKVPVTAVLVVRAPGGRSKEVSIYDATGVADQVERIAAGAAREQPLLQWETYEEVLDLCRRARVDVQF